MTHNGIPKTILKTYDHRRFDFEMRPNARPGELFKATRAFVWGPGDDLSDDHLHALAKRLKLNSIYTKKGEHPAMDVAWKEYNARIVGAKRGALRQLLAAAKVDGAEALAMPFSRTAGCGCGCSPGFVLKGLPRGFTIYATERTSKRAKQVKSLKKARG